MGTALTIIKPIEVTIKIPSWSAEDLIHNPFDQMIQYATMMAKRNIERKESLKDIGINYESREGRYIK